MFILYHKKFMMSRIKFKILQKNPVWTIVKVNVRSFLPPRAFTVKKIDVHLPWQIEILFMDVLLLSIRSFPLPGGGVYNDKFQEETMGHLTYNIFIIKLKRNCADWNFIHHLRRNVERIKPFIRNKHPPSMCICIIGLFLKIPR